MLGGLAGLTFGTADGVLKVMSDVIHAHGLGSLPTHWSIYVWLVVSPMAFLLQQSAFHIGHMGAAPPATSSLQPCVAAFLGAAMFGSSCGAAGPCRSSCCWPGRSFWASSASVDRP